MNWAEAEERDEEDGFAMNGKREEKSFPKLNKKNGFQKGWRRDLKIDTYGFNIEFVKIITFQCFESKGGTESENPKLCIENKMSSINELVSSLSFFGLRHDSKGVL